MLNITLKKEDCVLTIRLDILDFAVLFRESRFRNDVLASVFFQTLEKEHYVLTICPIHLLITYFR